MYILRTLQPPSFLGLTIFELLLDDCMIDFHDVADCHAVRLP